MAWRILSGVMRLSAAQKFSQLLHFSKRQRKEEDVTASLSLSGGIPSELQSHYPPVAFSPWATLWARPWASKTVGLGVVTSSPTRHFASLSLLHFFLTLLVVSDSLPLLQDATNTTVPDIYKHRLGHPLTTMPLFLVPLMLLVISHGQPQLLSVY